MNKAFQISLIISFLMFLLGNQGYSQYDYQIPKGSAELVNFKYKVDPMFFATQKLSWGAVESKCLENPAEFGMWLKVDVKTNQTKVTVTTLGKKGNVESPTLYFAKVEVNSKGRRLTEIKCQKFTGLEKEYSLEATGLDSEKEYYMLIAANALGQRFGVEVTEKFEPTPEQAEVKAEVEKSQSIVGRVRLKDGTTTKGIRVSLLNGVMQKVSETTTQEDGTFKFEKLPQEEVFLTKIEEEDTDMLVDVFLKNAEGQVTARATRIGTNLFGFGADSDAFNDLMLLTSADWTMNVAEGKTGVTGRIVDANTFLFGRKGLKVGLYNNQKANVSNTTTNVDGKFEFRDLALGDYSVKIENPSASDYSEVVVVDDLNVPFSYSNSRMLGADGFFKFEKLPADIVELKRLEERDSRMPALTSNFEGMAVGKAIVLKNILFESGSAQLKSSSFSELDKLVSELQSKPAIKIEISGHTDNQGNEATNKLLSENRAISVKKYLIQKGIAADRLTSKGMGSAKPLATNDTEEGRKQNRRVEFVGVK
jgi:outer membrane protein OmpA-like peptidoglycan-associated protein